LKVVVNTIKPKPNYFIFTESDVVVCIWVVSEDNSRSKFSVKVSHDSVTITVIAETIRRRSRISKEHAERCIEEYSDTYALKVCGCDLFLLEEHPLSQYKVGNCC
jgi:phosphatidylinositol-4,5-bisphosphate 3-kinase